MEIAGIIALAIFALGFAGYALRLSGMLRDQRAEADKQKGIAKDAIAAQAESDDRAFKVNQLRAADQTTIKRQKKDIADLRTLLRKHAPDGAAADQFARMLQEASGEDGDSDEDSDGGNPVSGG